MRKNTLKSLVVSCVLVCLSLLAVAQSVTIGSPSGTSGYLSGPIIRFSTNQSSNYSKFAYLYTKEELGIPSGSTITKVEWIKSNSASASGNNAFSVSLGNTNQTAFAATEYAGDLNRGSQMVYATTSLGYPSTSNYWLSFPTGNFTYTGSSLLVVADFVKVGTATGPLNFYCKTAPGKVVQVYSPAQILDYTGLVPTSGSVRPTIRIWYTLPVGCTVAPSPGSITSTKNNMCPDETFTLALTEKITGGGINYEWQSSRDSSFTNPTIIGNQASVTTSQVTSSYYRCKVSCGNSFKFTPSLFIRTKPFYQCYCSSTAQSPADEEIVHFKLGNLDNTSSLGNLNDPSASGLGYSECGELAPGENSFRSMYSNYRDISTEKIQIGSQVPFIVETAICGNSGAYNRCAIFLDANRNGVYETTEMIYLSSVIYGPTANVRKGFLTIPATAQSGLTGVRVVLSETQNSILPCGAYGFGETEDYTIELVTSLPSRSPGSVIASSTEICSGSQVLLYPQITYPNATYQWYINDVFIPGATNFFYEPIITKDAFFSVSVNDNQSSEVRITIKNFSDCYCESGAAQGADEDIVYFSLNGSSFSLPCTQKAPGQKSMLNRYSDYKPLGSLSTLKKGGSYNFVLVNDNCPVPQDPYYGASVAGWIDFNKNGSFDENEKVFQIDHCMGPKTMTGNISIPDDALTGTTVLRLVLGGGLWGPYLTPCSVFSSGETEDYTVSIED